MATFIGFSTVNGCRPQTTNPVLTNDTMISERNVVWGSKFRLTDQELVVRNFINALNIRQGTKVGQPGYGTTIWDLLFEPNTAALQEELETELRRIAAADPRIVFNQVNMFRTENVVIAEIQMAVAPFNTPFVTTINLDINTNTASLA
jgi:phage baseplate assembly protein W